MDDETSVFDSDCRTNFRFSPDHIFPDEWGILFDTYDFATLISTSGGSPQLRTLDVDGSSTASQGQVSHIHHCLLVANSQLRRLVTIYG